MRKYIVVVCIVCSILLAGCDSEKTECMYIKQVELTENERELLDIVGIQENTIYEYCVDDTIYSITLEATEYTKGEEPKKIGGGAISELQNRHEQKLFFDINLRTGYSKYRLGSATQQLTIDRSLSIVGNATAILREKREIIPGEEIPLMVIREHTTYTGMWGDLGLDIDYDNVFYNGKLGEYDNVIVVSVIFETE